MFNVLTDDVAVTETGIDADGTVVLAVAGVVDAHHIRAVHRGVIDALRRHRPHRIHLDLHGCTLIDTDGIRGLRLCRADAAQLDCPVDPIRASAPVRSILQAAGIIETHH
jgi:anti-anti-sigma regulatory factor